MSDAPSAIPPEAAPPLPADLVQVTATAQGLELYFPPLRARAASLGLAGFGVTCAAMPVIAAAALVSALDFDAHGMLVVALLAGFAVPLFALGLTFVALGAYQLANSLYVRVERAGIASGRRAFGIAFGRKLVAAADVTAIEPQIAARFQTPFSAEPSYRLIARTRAPAPQNIVVAEGLVGAPLMNHIRTMIERAAGVARARED